MTSLQVPAPRYNQYRPGTSFVGYIVSIQSIDTRHFFVFDEANRKQFEEIEKIAGLKRFQGVPEFGRSFIYVRDGVKYRAVKISSNPADPCGIRVLLYDYGEVIFSFLEPENIFELPDALKFPAMALFCCLDTNQLIKENITDFLQKSLKHCTRLRFTVKNLMSHDTEWKQKSRCLSVEVAVETAGEDKTGDEAHPVENVEDEVTFGEEPIKLNEIKKAPPLQPGTIVMAYFTEISSINKIFVQTLGAENVKIKTLTPAIELQRWMNKESVTKQYRAFEDAPAVGDMVLTKGRMNVFRRGMVEEHDGKEFFSIFFVDYGYTMIKSLKDLFVFPLKCKELPCQAYQLNVPNMTSLLQIEGFRLRKNTSRVMAKVLSSEDLKLTADIYDLAGKNLLSNSE